MAGKADNLIVKAKRLTSVPYHDISRAEQELGPVFSFVDGQNFPGQDIVIRMRRVDQVPPDLKPYVDPHTHEVGEFYIATEGLTIEVLLGDETHEIEGPATAFVPAGMKHTVRPLRGKGYLIVILRKADYP